MAIQCSVKFTKIDHRITRASNGNFSLCIILYNVVSVKNTDSLGAKKIVRIQKKKIIGIQLGDVSHGKSFFSGIWEKHTDTHTI